MNFKRPFYRLMSMYKLTKASQICKTKKDTICDICDWRRDAFKSINTFDTFYWTPGAIEICCHWIIVSFGITSGKKYVDCSLHYSTLFN